jgi:uncharacterized membrane protein
MKEEFNEIKYGLIVLVIFLLICGTIIKFTIEEFAIAFGIGILGCASYILIMFILKLITKMFMK